MKKIFALLLAMMLAGSLVSCDGKQPNTQAGENMSASEESQNETDSATPAEQDNPEDPKIEEPVTSNAQPTIEEAVIYDDGGVKVTAKGLEFGSWEGPALKLLIENDSDQNLAFQSRTASVNGYMCETMMHTEVAMGKKANDTLTFSQSQLDASGVTTITDIEFVLHVINSETWEDVTDSAPIVIRTSAAGSYEQAYDDSGEMVVDNDGIRVVVKGLENNVSQLGPSVIVEIINSSDRDVMVQARDTSVNGFMVEPYFSAEACAGKRAINTITFSAEELSSNDIEAIQNVDLSFHVFDLHSWNDIFDTEIVSLTF